MNYTEEELFEKFFNGGNFTLPFLIKFSCPEIRPICLVNDNVEITYLGHTYKPSTFEYSPPDLMGNGASLKISGIDNDLLFFIESNNGTARLDIVGIIAEDGEIQKIKQYTHFLGNVTYNEKEEFTFNLESDDRLEMTFPPYKFDTEINKGNS